MTAECGLPLQNRVDPFGELFATTARGLFMGNRGGRIHTDDRTLTKRRWASRQWICCVLDFKDRQRDVWGRYYTELFFLDEVTALAAGHRPCFECRRKDAEAFAEPGSGRSSFRGGPAPMRWIWCCTPSGWMAAPSGCTAARSTICPMARVVALEEEGACAVRGNALLRWTPKGYDASKRRPRGTTVDVLTPPAILGVLAAGYRPHWHPSAESSLHRRLDRLDALAGFRRVDDLRFLGGELRRRVLHAGRWC